MFFVGATGATGQRIVKEVIGRGVSVKAGVRDFEKAKSVFGNNPDPGLEFVRLRKPKP